MSLGRTKTAGRGCAAHQYVRIDDYVSGPLVEAVLALRGASPRMMLVPEGPLCFRRRWKELLAALGVPHTSQHGLIPAGLRAGGATQLFLQSDDLSKVKWMGRWARESTCWRSTLAREVASASVLPSFTQEVRRKVQDAAARGPQVVQLRLERQVCIARLHLRRAELLRSDHRLGRSGQGRAR